MKYYYQIRHKNFRFTTSSVFIVPTTYTKRVVYRPETVKEKRYTNKKTLCPVFSTLLLQKEVKR